MTPTTTLMDNMTTQAMRRLVAQRMVLRDTHPLWGTLSMNLRLTVDASCPTGWTDGTRIGFNPAWVMKQTAAQLRFFIAHETQHCALHHPYRRGTRDQREANIAMDYVINGDLQRAGFILSDNVFIDTQFTGHSWEWVYAKRAQQKRDDAQQNPQQSDDDTDSDDDNDDNGSNDTDSDDDNDTDSDDDSSSDDSSDDGAASSDDDAQGSGSGNDAGDDAQGSGNSGSGDAPADDSDGTTGEPGAGECDVRDAPADNDADDMSAQDWTQAIEVAARITSRSETHSDSARRLLAHAREDACGVDWQSVLMQFCTERAQSDYTYRRPNRNYVAHGMYLPSMHSDAMGALCIYLDTSGSVDSHALGLMQRAVRDLVDACDPVAVHVIYYDTAERGRDTFMRNEPVTLHQCGGGGTDFTYAFTDAVLADLDPEPVCIVFLTDCDARYPEHAPELPVLWVRTGQSAYAHKVTPPWGDVVEMPG